MAAIPISYPPHIPDVPSNSQEFIDRLEYKKSQAERGANNIVKTLNSLNALKTELGTHKSEIEAYFANLKTTNQLAKELNALLFITMSKSSKVGSNAGWAMKGIHSLLVNVRDTLDAVEALRDLVNDLLNRINKLNDSGLDPSKSLYKMLLDLKTLVSEAMTSMNTVVADTLKVLLSANVLDNALNDESEGLQTQLQDMVTHLKTGIKPGLEDPDLPVYGPLPTFPLEDCDDDYYDRLKAEVSKIAEDYKNLEDVVKIADRQKYIMVSRRDVIINALAAAKAAQGQS